MIIFTLMVIRSLSNLKTFPKQINAWGKKCFSLDVTTFGDETSLSSMLTVLEGSSIYTWWPSSDLLLVLSSEPSPSPWRWKHVLLTFLSCHSWSHRLPISSPSSFHLVPYSPPLTTHRHVCFHLQINDSVVPLYFVITRMSAMYCIAL